MSNKAGSKSGGLRPKRPHKGTHSGRLKHTKQQLAEVAQRAAAYRGFGVTQQDSAAKPVPPVAYKAESAQAAGFLR